MCLDVLDYDGSPAHFDMFRIDIYGNLVFQKKRSRHDIIYLNHILNNYGISFKDFMMKYLENNNANFVFEIYSPTLKDL